MVRDAPTSRHPVVEYGWRFAMEEHCLADKAKGVQLESSLVRAAAALTRWWLGLARTTLSLVAQGTQVVRTPKRRWGAPPWLRGNSSGRLGWPWVKTALARGWALCATLHLSGMPAPDPSRASTAQARSPQPLTFTQTICYTPT